MIKNKASINENKTSILKILLFIFISFYALSAYSQDLYSSLFYNDFSALNPAYTGMLENNRVNFHTSQHKDSESEFKYSSGNTSINIPITKLYSGIGFHAAYSGMHIDMLTSSNLDFGFIYSFKYAINEHIKLSLGSDFSIYRYKIKGTLFYPGDAWNSSGEFYDTQENIKESVFLFNIDIGFWANIYGFQIGITNKHINEPSKEFYFLYSNINLVLNYDFRLGAKHALSNSLVMYDLNEFSANKYFGLNNHLIFNKKIIAGLTTKIFKSDEFQYILSPNFGFNLSDKFKFIASIDLIKINYYNDSTIEAILNFNF